MSKKSLLLIISAATIGLGVTIPALARTDHTGLSHKDALVLTRHYGPRVGRRLAVPATATESATLARQGFTCEVAIATGANGQTKKDYFVLDSQEFYIAYTQGGSNLESLTTNCVGKLPAGTTGPSTIVSHQVGCSQFQPTGSKTPAIQGWGISTTYPDGMYSETCNTPNY